MTDSERLTSVIKWSKMTTNEFSASLGSKRAMNLYNVLNGKTTLSVKLCNSICNKYHALIKAETNPSELIETAKGIINQLSRMEK